MRTLYFAAVVTSFFFLTYSQRSKIGCLPTHGVALARIQNACLKCAARVSLEIQDAKMTQKSPSAQHRTTLSSYIFATTACIHNRKTKTLHNNISSISPYNMANVGPVTADIGSVVWGTQANYDGFRVLASLLQRHRSPEANQTVHDVSRSPWLVEYSFSGAKFTLRPSFAFSYIGSVTARHSSNGHQPNFVAWYKELNHGTFADGAADIRLGGHHVGHRSTFQLCSGVFRPEHYYASWVDISVKFSVLQVHTANWFLR